MPKNTTPVVISKAFTFETSTEEPPQDRQNKQMGETEKESRSLEKQAEQNKDVSLDTVRILQGTENDSYPEMASRVERLIQPNSEDD